MGYRCLQDVLKLIQCVKNGFNLSLTYISDVATLYTPACRNTGAIQLLCGLQDLSIGTNVRHSTILQEDINDTCTFRFQHLGSSQYVIAFIDHEIEPWGSRKNSKLTATESSGELDVVRPAPIAKRHNFVAGWYGAPGLQTTVSVHIKAEEVAIADGNGTVSGIKRKVCFRIWNIECERRRH